MVENKGIKSRFRKSSKWGESPETSRFRNFPATANSNSFNLKHQQNGTTQTITEKKMLIFNRSEKAAPLNSSFVFL